MLKKSKLIFRTLMLAKYVGITLCTPFFTLFSVTSKKSFISLPKIFSVSLLSQTSAMHTSKNDLLFTQDVFSKLKMGVNTQKGLISSG